MICWDGKRATVWFSVTSRSRQQDNVMPIRQIPLLHRRYRRCVAMAASSQSKAVLPGWGEGWICSVNPRCKIEKLRTAMWVARRWNQTSAVPKHIEKGLKHRQNHIESWSPTITYTQTQFAYILSSGKKHFTVDLTGTYRTGFPDGSFLLCSPKMLLPTWKPLDFTQNLNLALMWLLST